MWVFGPMELSAVKRYTTLTTDPGDDRRPIFVIVVPTGLAFLAALSRLAAQRLLFAVLGLALVAGRVIEVIRLDRPFQLTTDLIGQGGIAQPPTSPIAGADMDL